MYEAAFKNIDNSLRKDEGCSTEIDYTEQKLWILFLKYLNDFEQEKERVAQLNNQIYNYILKEEFRWDIQVAPKKDAGSIDHNKSFTGDDLLEFVYRKLFPYLKSFKLE